MGAASRTRLGRLIVIAATLLGSLGVVFSSTPSTVGADLTPDPAAALAGGTRHRCVVLADQTVRCWGANDRGQLGDGTTTASLVPVEVQGLTDVVAIDSGIDFSCALTASGTVGCWGRNTSGSLGDPGAGSFETTPTFANGLTDVVEIALGSTHACARLGSGAVRCWGDNDDEQLGDGTSTDTAVPVPVVGLSDTTQLAAGLATTCAVRVDATLTCWGANPNGLFGDGTTSGSSTPRDIGEAGQVRQVEIGLVTSCVVGIDGRARCAGAGPLGDGSDSSSSTFVDVDLPRVLDISVGGEICAIVPDASVWCWGPAVRLIDDSFDGAIAFAGEVVTPERVDGLSGVTSIDAATAHTCAGTIDAKVSCWGINVGGELQIGTTVLARPGDTVPGVTADQVSTNASTCARTSSGGVTCWGFDPLLLVQGSEFLEPRPPTAIDGLTGAVDVSTHFLHTCAALGDGTVQCWGLNFAGELGFPATSDLGGSDVVPHPPAAVAGVANADEVASGSFTTCATAGPGAVCWGAGADGQLGNGATPDTSPTPTMVITPPMTTDVDMIVAGGSHACARLSIAFFGQFVHCWGQNAEGQIGDGTTNDATTATQTGVAGPKSIAAGNSHTCAIDFADDLYCWGQNADGQIGSGFTSPSVPTPTIVAGLPLAPTQVAAGSDHTCALLTDATVACWGDNEYRQTGQNVFGDVLTPMIVPGLSGVVSIDAGFDSTCAILADSSVTCWGNNSFGITGTSPFVAAPADMGITSLLTPPTLRTEPIFHPVAPARLLETRDGLSTVDGAARGGGAVRGGTQIEVPVAGRAGIPDDARFAVVNVTAVNPEANGFLTVHGCLSPRPNVASLNYTNLAGDGPINLGNESIVELSANGGLCIFTSTTTELTVDVTAYGIAAGGYTPTTPERILETRAGKSTDDGEFELGGPLTSGTEIELDVVGRAGITDRADAAVVYIAAVNPTGVGFVTAHPCLADRPLASSLNYSATPGGVGITRGNEVIAPLSDDGTVCLYVSTTTDLTVDVMGSIDVATTYEAVSPARLLETRLGLDTVDGEGLVGAPVAGGTEVVFRVGDRAGVDAGATLAALNITAVRPSANGFVTAHPCEPELPLASSLNFAVPPVSGPINGGNEVLVPLSESGTVCLFVSDTTHLTVDVVGYS